MVTIVPAGPLSGRKLVIEVVQDVAAVRKKSSIANPSCEPAISRSLHLIQNIVPFGIAKLVIVEVISVLLVATLPSSAPATAVVFGDIKSRAVTAVHEPVVKLVAFVLYSKIILSALPVAPNLHCSPVYEMTNEEIEVPVLFINEAPIVGFKLPDCKPPNALSAAEVAPKLYVSPVATEPVPAEYVVFAFAKASLKVQPVGTVLDVPVEASVLKS